mmetsp:Transcript_16447/g.62491  ORF Transcript_16447/g.62491 Transcript_16447/m.62491 type:complete len:367 (-) Transcript_16447:1493-2593(-)
MLPVRTAQAAALLAQGRAAVLCYEAVRADDARGSQEESDGQEGKEGGGGEAELARLPAWRLASVPVDAKEGSSFFLPPNRHGCMICPLRRFFDGSNSVCPIDLQTDACVLLTDACAPLTNIRASTTLRTRLAKELVRSPGIRGASPRDEQLGDLLHGPAIRDLEVVTKIPRPWVTAMSLWLGGVGDMLVGGASRLVRRRRVCGMVPAKEDAAILHGPTKHFVMPAACPVRGRYHCNSLLLEAQNLHGVLEVANVRGREDAVPDVVRHRRHLLLGLLLCRRFVVLGLRVRLATFLQRGLQEGILGLVGLLAEHLLARSGFLELLGGAGGARPQDGDRVLRHPHLGVANVAERERVRPEMLGTGHVQR